MFNITMKLDRLRVGAGTPVLLRKPFTSTKLL